MSRFVIQEVKSCEGCPHFRDDICAEGDAVFSCIHPKGPGGKLTEDIVILKQIHDECPLPKTIDLEELIDALQACSSYFHLLGQGVNEETAQELTDTALKNHGY